MPLLLVSALMSLFHITDSRLASCLPLNSAHSPVTGLVRAHSHLESLHEKGKQKVLVLQPGEANLPLACYLPLLPPILCLSLWTPSPRGRPCMSQCPRINLTNCRKEKWKERGQGVETIRDLSVIWGKVMNPTQAATRLPSPNDGHHNEEDVEESDALVKPWLWQSIFEMVNAAYAKRAYWEPQTPDKQLGNY